MSSNICGNCENFKPKKDERFFNCTSAKHAGVSYGMQVRADSRACDAFLPYKATSTTPSPSTPLSQKPATKTIRKQSEERQRPTGLCPWGRVILIAAIVIIILIVAGLAYMCASNLSSSPEATPTPTPTPTIPIGPPVGPTPPPTPTPTPIPIYEYQYYEIGANGWASSPTQMVLISSVSRVSSYSKGVGSMEVAPPGTMFIFINVSVINRSSKSGISVTGANFFLADSDGFSYPAQLSQKPYYIPQAFGGYIGPGQTINGNILYVVPIPAKELDVSYLIDPNAYPLQVARWRLPW